MVPPFVRVGERLHLVVNWTPGTRPEQWLLLRPLTDGEEHEVRHVFADAAFEAWALVVPNDRARTRGRA